MLRELNTVTPSDIFNVYNNGPPRVIDRKAITEGIEAHKRLIGEAKDGLLPSSLRKAGVYDVCAGEKSFRINIGPDNLHLSARIDMMSRRDIVEIKPGPIMARYFLQAAIEVMVTEQDLGAVVYLYKSGKAYQLGNAGRPFWPQILDIARDTRIILDNQARADEMKKELGCHRNLTGRNGLTFESSVTWNGGYYQEKMRLGRQAVEARRRFDENIKSVSVGLSGLARTVG